MNATNNKRNIDIRLQLENWKTFYLHFIELAKNIEDFFLVIP